MHDQRARVIAKKREFDGLRPLPSRALKSLQAAHDFELVWSSNAIEGNTLTLVETQLVVEKGLTIGGKPLKDHLEAVDLSDALQWVREIAGQAQPLTETDIRALHALTMKRSAPELAGRHATSGRYVNIDAGRRAFPAPSEIPSLMGDFAGWLATAPPTPDNAFAAHLRLVEIHPFDDGNGRTARLLMNLVLLRAGYPPVAVRPADRAAYIRSLQRAAQDDGAEFAAGLFARLDETLDEYLAAARTAPP